MYRRFAVTIVLTLCAVTTGAADAPRAHEGAHEGALPRLESRLDLRALFELAPGVISDDEHGIMIGPLSVELVVAQIGPDGKLIKACVHSEDAAHRFFERPVAQNVEAQEQ